MSKSLLRAGLLLCTLLGASTARADFVSVLQSTPVSASTSVAFQNSNVTPGTVSADGVYNFLDKWTFTLDGAFLVSSIAAAINFTDASGRVVLLGISNLQVNLLGDPPTGSPLVSWLTVTTPVSGLQQSVALIPPSALGAGNYALEVRGTVTQPGAYSGSVIAQPVQAVPLPSTLALFACGIMAIGFASNRLRRR
jgi:preprotein translocase subunit SecG